MFVKTPANLGIIAQFCHNSLIISLKLVIY